MMKKIIFVLIMLSVFSCKKDTKTLKGILAFKLVNLTSPDGMNENETKKIENYLDSVNINAMQPNDELIIKYLRKLKNANLLRLPFIRLRVNDNRIQTVFLEKKEYFKLKKYNLEYLKTNQIKLEMELKIEKINDSIFYSDKIITLVEVAGITFVEK